MEQRGKMAKKMKVSSWRRGHRESRICSPNQNDWRRWPQTLQWRVPVCCGHRHAEVTRGRSTVCRVDTIVQCPGCGTLVHHHLPYGLCRKEAKGEDIPDDFLTARPDEGVLLRGISCRPRRCRSRVYAVIWKSERPARPKPFASSVILAGIPEGNRAQELLARRSSCARPYAEWFALVVRLGPAALCLIGSRRATGGGAAAAAGLGVNVRSSRRRPERRLPRLLHLLPRWPAAWHPGSRAALRWSHPCAGCHRG